MIGGLPRFRGLCALALCAALVAAACTTRREPREERDYRARATTGDLVIAVPWPWELRKEIRYGEGLQLAVDEVNAAGGFNGRKLRLAKYDDHESINDGRVIAQEIADNPDVVAVIGHLQSYITVQAATVYDQAGLVLVAPTATDPDLTERGYARVFRICFTDRSVGAQLADFAAARSLKRFGIYYIRNQYGRTVSNSFEARAGQIGLTVSARGSYDPGGQVSERTFEQVLGEWKLMDLEAIMLAGEVPSAAIFVAQARKSGIRLPILGGDAMSSPGLMAVAGAAAEGIIVASYFHPDEPRAEVGRFNAAFQKRYGVPPDAGSALGYDAVHLIAHAMRQAKSAVPDDVARALHALERWPGVTGAFTFDENGDALDKRVVLSIVRRGQFDYLARPDATPSNASARTGRAGS